MALSASGLIHHDTARATPGFTVYSVIRGPRVHLLDMEGRMAHEWALEKGGINLAYLLENGNLFVTEASDSTWTPMQGKGGRMREYDWDGNLVWEHHDPGQHHDARRLANGNTMYLGWERLSEADAGRVQGGMEGTEGEGGEILGDYIREVTPGGDTVWEWHASSMEMEKYPICPLCHRHEFAHANTVVPLENGDVMLGFRVLNLIIIIDRASGEIKWQHQDFDFGHQHDCHMLENGNVMLFANGHHTDKHTVSRVVEFDPETRETVWQYRAPAPLSFFSPHISGAQRLWSGNTLICSGGQGRLFEVTPEGETVWEYVAPIQRQDPEWGDFNWVFRAYRYAADSPQIQGRV